MDFDLDDEVRFSIDAYNDHFGPVWIIAVTSPTQQSYIEDEYGPESAEFEIDADWGEDFLDRMLAQYPTKYARASKKKVLAKLDKGQTAYLVTSIRDFMDED